MVDSRTVSTALLALATIVTPLTGCSSSSADGQVSPHEVIEVRRFDAEKNGVHEAQELRYRGMPVCEVRDSDQNGSIDRWLYYEDGKEVVVAKDRNADGQLDWWWFRTAEGEGLASEDSNYDGTVDKVFSTAVVTKH